MSRTAPQLDILYEDNHLLVVNKQAMLPTMGVAETEPSLLKIAKEYIRIKYAKPGNVYLGIVSRLDTPVTGVTVLARTSKAAARLSAAFRDRAVEKTYWAVVEGLPSPAQGTLEHYLRKDERHRKVHVTHQNAPDAQLARLTYEVLNKSKGYSLLEIALETGRKHQIRVQLSKLGHPIVGDKKYGSRIAFARGIALHARRLVLNTPSYGRRWSLSHRCQRCGAPTLIRRDFYKSSLPAKLISQLLAPRRAWRSEKRRARLNRGGYYPLGADEQYFGANRAIYF